MRADPRIAGTLFLVAGVIFLGIALTSRTRGPLLAIGVVMCILAISQFRRARRS